MLGTINDVSIDDFMAASGVHLAIERTCAPEHLIGHEAERWHHYRVCVWREGIHREYYGFRSLKYYQTLTGKTELALMIDDFRKILAAKSPDEFAATYGAGLTLYPDLAERYYEKGHRQAENMRKVMGEWFDFMIANVDVEDYLI